MSASDNTTPFEVFQTHFATLQFDGADDAFELGATIVPESMRLFQEDVDALHTLPRLAVRAPGQNTLNPDLDVIGTLGEGGMGLVRLAEQISLKRNVAVKTLREANQRQAAESLLKEAYITGHLEHPNVIPIYTLGRDDSGAPLIVMKRIEGRSWAEVLDDDRADGHVDLDRHVDILLQVCNAVRFAHSRRILHRDIKLENVMIGAYDEVYLLDWGIAITLDESSTVLPKRQDAVGVAGTPSYMAPEMTRDDALEVDETTDVYLLGATLHHILTGSFRHQGTSLFQIMFAASKSEPATYGPDVPAPLGAIANKACSLDKGERYASASEFRSAVQDWVDHKGSIEVTAEAERSREILDELLERERDSAIELRIHDIIGECRFGYRQALRMWPENSAALQGQRSFLRQVFEFHLEQEQPVAARSILSELAIEEPSDEHARVDEVAARLSKARVKVTKLEKMAASLDLRTAATSRSRLAFMLGSLWAISTSYSALRIDIATTSNEVLQEWNMSGLVRSIIIVAVGIFIFRKRVFANFINRRIVYLLFATLGSMFVMRTIYWLFDGSYTLAQASETTLYAFSIMVLGLTSDLRICALSAIYLVAAFVGAFYPEYQIWVLVPAHLGVFFSLAWIWTPSQVSKRVTVDRS